MKELHYNVTGQDRKELVGIISKVVGMKAVYKFMPTCAFVISNITVEKDGTMVWDERTDQDTIEAVIMNAYEIKTNLSRAKISHLMDAETWMNANKAMELGFIDDVLSREEVSDDDGQPTAPMMYSEATVVNSLMGKIAEKCRIASKPAQPDVPQGRSVNELRERLDTIKKFI